jgi:hypothetical protein
MAVIYYNATDLKRFGEHIAEWVQKGMKVPNVDGKIEVTNADIENWKLGLQPAMTIQNVVTGMRISIYRRDDVKEFIDSLRNRTVFQIGEFSLFGHWDDDDWTWDHGVIDGLHVPERYVPREN